MPRDPVAVHCAELCPSKMDCVHDSTESKRISTKSYLLTYSQTSLTKAQLYAFLSSRPDVERLIVAEEKHQDGNLHLHAYVVYNKQRDVNFHAFDIGGEHPNIGTHKVGMNPVQSHWNCWQYCCKEDKDPMIIGSPPPEPPPPRPAKRSREGAQRGESAPKRMKKDDLIRAAIETVKRRDGSVKEAFEDLLERMPAYALEKANVLRAELQRIRSDTLCPSLPPRPLSAFKYAPRLPDNWRVLFLSGPTKYGKTAYARALLPGASVLSHKDQLKDADMTQGLIFDDNQTSHLPITFVIHLLDWDEPRGVDVKHGCVVIPAHTRKIFTSNKTFDAWLEAIDDEKCPRTEEERQACRRRVHVVNVNTPLYDPLPSGPCESGQDTPRDGDGNPPVTGETDDPETEPEEFGFSAAANQYEGFSE